MNINFIKKKITNLKKEKLKIKVNLGRNKYEYLEGKVEKMYNNIFTLDTNKGIRCFSYSDLATGVVIINKF